MRAILALVALLVLAGFSFSVDIGTCTNISSPGTYALTADLTGAPVSSPEVLNGMSCIKINSSGVTLDCAGHTLNGAGSTGFPMGIFVTSVSGTVVKNCPSISGYNYGVASWNSDNGLYTNITSHDNADFGFIPTGSTNNTFANGLVYNNGYGMYIWNGNVDTTIANTTFHDNSPGIYVFESNRTMLVNDHFYNNAVDVHEGSFSADSIDLTLDGVAFDSPAGTFQAFTNVSLNSTINANQNYFMSFGNQPAALPGNFISFNQKYLVITSSGSPTITNMVMSWNPGEVTGNLRESKFSLYRYNGTWAQMPATLNTGTHTLSLSGFVPGSTYAILMDFNCPLITAPGSFTMTADMSGFPNNAAPAAGQVCVKLGGPDFVFDCNGFSINGNHTSLTYGIDLNDSATNVTVQNCNVQGYEGGVTTTNANGSVFTNIASHNNTLAGFFITGVNGGDSNFNRFDNDSAYNNTPYGFYLVEGGHNNITNSNSFGNSIGFYCLFSAHDYLLMGDNATGNTNDGFNCGSGNNNNSFVSDISSGNGRGFFIGALGTTISGSTASGNAGDGIFLSGSTNTSMPSNHLFNNGRDLHVSFASYTAPGTIFDNPSGNFQSYTNLSLDDSTGSNGEYGVNWSAVPAALPNGYSPFNNKYLSITSLGGTPSIDKATWNWLPSEVGSFSESGIHLLEYNGGWTARNVTPDTGNHQLSLSGLSSFSVFALLVNNNVSALKVDVTPLLPSPGGMTQWRINVTNAGSGPLDPVAVTDTLPSGLQFVAATPAPDSVSPDNLTVNWNNIGSLASGASAIIVLNASVDANASNGTYYNSVNVSATPVNATAITASDSTPIGIFAPGLSVVKSVAASATTGLDTLFTINITNTGSINLTLSVADTLPNNTIFRGADVTPSGASNRSVNWTSFAVLPVGGSLAIHYNVSFIIPGTYVNNVSVTGVPPNGNSVTDNSSASVMVSAPQSGGGDNGPAQSLSASLQSNCSGNTVTVSGGGPVDGADVLVDGNPVGTTDQNGQVSFQGCGSTVTIRASKSGYQDGVTSQAEVACGQCAPPKCTSNVDCPSSQFCQVNANASLNQCLPVSCSCGTVQSHECVNFQCCSDKDCGAGMLCSDHQCKPKQAGCTSDAQCGGDQRCTDPTGAPATEQSPGVCHNITGQCGVAANHAFIPYNYTCGPEPGCPSCPSGQSCVAHQCISTDISCPSSGQVGENKTCQLTENNKACSPDQNCTATVVTPDGKQFNVVPDEDGNVQLPLTVQGKYTITLLKDGQVVKQVFVNAVPKSAPSEPEKPAAAGPDAFTMLWLLILLAIVVGVVIYWRSRGQNR